MSLQQRSCELSQAERKESTCEDLRNLELQVSESKLVQRNRVNFIGDKMLVSIMPISLDNMPPRTIERFMGMKIFVSLECIKPILGGVEFAVRHARIPFNVSR